MPTALYDKNILLLKERFPIVFQKIAVEHSSATFNAPATFSNLAITAFSEKIDKGNHSLFLPCERNSDFARNLINRSELKAFDIMFCLGMGLGYIPLAAVEGFPEKPRIVVIEPDIDMLRHALKHIDLTDLFCYERLELFVGHDLSAGEIVDRYKSVIPIGKVRLLEHPGYADLLGSNFVNLAENLKQSIGMVRDLRYTTKQHGRRILANTLANLPSLFCGSGLNVIKSQFRGIPAVCVAAGPSLDGALSSLKQIQSNALIIACDSSVNALHDNGIKPHIVVTTDIFDTNYRKLHSHLEHLRDSVLIFGIESNPDNVNRFLTNKRITVSSSSKILLDWLSLKLGMDCRLPSLTSVSQMAVFTALGLGADPLILVGMDLSYPAGKSHSEGAALQEDLNSKKLTKIAGINGNHVFSSPQLIADKVFLENQIAQKKNKIINTSLNGAIIKGTENKSIEEILKSVTAKNVKVNRILPQLDWASSHSNTDAIAELNEMLQKIHNFNDLCDRNENLIKDHVDAHNNKFKGSSDHFESRVNAIKRDFEHFQKEYDLILGVSELAIGEDIHEILKKGECLAAKDYRDPVQKRRDEIDLIADHYRAFSKGADFFCQHLSKITAELERAQCLKDASEDFGTQDRRNNHLRIGSHYADTAEIWQAEREYLKAAQNMPRNPTPWLELTSMFADLELWQPARNAVEKACRLFPGNTELSDLRTDIEARIQDIMSQIKDAWVTGDKETTRRLLSGYLLLCPDDESANLLREVLKEVDETLAAMSPIAQQQKSSQLPFDELVANASQYIENLEFERAIGIMEGLIQSYPQMKAAFREKIGDIRMLQKDYPSAVWNFEQVLNATPIQAAAIEGKFNQAKKELEYDLKDSCHPGGYVY